MRGDDFAVSHRDIDLMQPVTERARERADTETGVLVAAVSDQLRLGVILVAPLMQLPETASGCGHVV
jgi:hypothetical protein